MDNQCRNVENWSVKISKGKISKDNFMLIRTKTSIIVITHGLVTTQYFKGRKGKTWQRLSRNTNLKNGETKTEKQKGDTRAYKEETEVVEKIKSPAAFIPPSSRTGQL